MSSESHAKTPYWKILLDLGRVSNLPTVWSNCLAGWLIGGGGSINSLAVLCFSASLVYVGGMYLNDAFDVTWDLDHKNDRPIPAGLIAERPVWILGWVWMVIGFGGFATLGAGVAMLAAQLVFFVIAYDAFHKRISWSPVLMAACRFYLVLSAAAVSGGSLSGYAVWVALVLALYIVGLSYLARAECLPGLLRHWPIAFLVAPVVLAAIVNDGGAREKGLVAALILVLWVIKSLRHLLWTAKPSVGRAVSGLLAGICLVDLLAVATVQPAEAAVFLGLFLFSLGLQRVIAAT